MLNLSFILEIHILSKFPKKNSNITTATYDKSESVFMECYNLEYFSK